MAGPALPKRIEARAWMDTDALLEQIGAQGAASVLLDALATQIEREGS